MKVLATIAALLFSFSAFSQDLIEYRDFKFYQNGVEISIEEVTELTKEYGVVKLAFRQGRRDFAASQNISRARGRNLINGVLSYSAGLGGIGGIALGAYWLDGGLSDGDMHPAAYITSFTLGAISAGGMIYYGRLLATKKKFKKRADKKFQKTAQKLNEAIQLGKSQ